MNRLDRLFGILTLLQSRKYVSAEKIADKFHISIRTVYRDIKTLGEQGIPVSFEPNKGYFVVPGYFLPPVSFSNDEANALLLMEAMVKGFADKSILKHYTTALSKVRSVMQGSQKDQLEVLDSNIRMQLPAVMMHDMDHLSALQQSIASRTIISIDYRNAKEETSSRQLEPIGLIFYAFSWHLIAWCHLRNEYRDFKVARIQKVNNLDKAFRKAVHMPLSEYMKDLPVDY